MRLLPIVAVSIVVLQTNGIVFDHYETSSKGIYSLSASQSRQLTNSLEVKCDEIVPRSGKRNGLGLRRGETAIINGGEFLVKCQ